MTYKTRYRFSHRIGSYYVWRAVPGGTVPWWTCSVDDFWSKPQIGDFWGKP